MWFACHISSTLSSQNCRRFIFCCVLHSILTGIQACLDCSLVDTVWRFLSLQIHETASRYGEDDAKILNMQSWTADRGVSAIRVGVWRGVKRANITAPSKMSCLAMPERICVFVSSCEHACRFFVFHKTKVNSWSTGQRLASQREFYSMELAEKLLPSVTMAIYCTVYFVSCCA
jgi:hypothetical protein